LAAIACIEAGLRAGEPAMGKSAVVLAVPHQIQGPGFQSYIKDPSYKLLVKNLMQSNGIDFVFEEAAGRGPSIAEKLANSFGRPVGYLDMDPAPDDRPKYGIARQVGGGGPIDPCNSPDVYESSKVDEQRKREELWLERMLLTAFAKGLVIVGSAHGLSVAFRLSSAGVSVIDNYQYMPYDKLCRRSHES
jgi:hypothetical protein